MIKFRFNIEKAVAAVAFLCKQNGGYINKFRLIKTLYLADRSFFLDTHRTITGDKMVSMQKGPVLSIIYNLTKGEAEKELASVWNEFFENTADSWRDFGNNRICLKKEPDMSVLSELEREKLTESRLIVASKRSPDDLVNFLHTLPEWKDPSNSCVPIDLEDVLKDAGLQQDLISRISGEILASERDKDVLLKPAN